MSETFSKVEVITGVGRRRRFTTEQKLSVVNETPQPGLSISYVSRPVEPQARLCDLFASGEHGVIKSCQLKGKCHVR